MSDILPELLKQIAVYWPPGAADRDNIKSPGTAREIACRWNPKQIDRVDAQGSTYVSTAQIYHEDANVALEGYFWLSTYTTDDPAGSALAAAPTGSNIPKNKRVKETEHVPDVDNDEQLYMAFV